MELPAADPWERVHHVAVYVRDLRRAEDLYTGLFGMDVVFREVWHEETEEMEQVPPERTWAETAAMDGELVMSFVRRGGIVLALGKEEEAVPEGGAIDHLNVRVEPDDLADIEERAADFGCELAARENPYHTYVRDPFGVTWELRDVSAE